MAAQRAVVVGRAGGGASVEPGGPGARRYILQRF